MFDYPIPVPKYTLYHELGIGPEASVEEVAQAQRAVLRLLTEEKKTIDHKLRAIYVDHPGLQQKYQERERLLKDESSTAEESLNQIEKEIFKIERKIEKVYPKFKGLREQSDFVEKKIIKFNNLPLTNPDEREQYDQENPPFAILKLEDNTKDAFTNNKSAIALIRKELTEFFIKQGEPVAHPSDLNRKNFIADFNTSALLDGEINE